jgi:flagellar biosynthesis GTPase FlhF
MKIQRYIARDMRSALAQVREALGPDAVILSSGRVGSDVEVVAAMDFEVARAVDSAPPPARVHAAHQLDDSLFVVAIDLLRRHATAVARGDVTGFRAVGIGDGDAGDVGLRDEIMDRAETHAAGAEDEHSHKGRIVSGKAQSLTPGISRSTQ